MNNGADESVVEELLVNVEASPHSGVPEGLIVLGEIEDVEECVSLVEVVLVERREHLSTWQLPVGHEVRNHFLKQKNK